MLTLHLLGTGAAFSDAARTTTMLAVEHRDAPGDAPRLVLVDCGGDAVQRMLASGLDVDALAAVVVTHEHPDHVGGFALLIERLWLAGRRTPLPVVGLPAAIAQARRVLEAFDTSGWTDLFALDWRAVDAPDDGASGEAAAVLTDGALRITGRRVVHGPPTLGLRVEDAATGRVAAYSCDTEPCDAVVRLAEGADVLVHEATGATKGHSSAEQAADVAARAGVGRCVLVHLPPGATDDGLVEARASFAAVTLGSDGDRIEV